MTFTKRDDSFERPLSAERLSEIIEQEIHISPNGLSEDIDKVTFIFDHDLEYREMNLIRDIMNRRDYTEL